MYLPSKRYPRRGTILPLLALCVVVLCGFVALGIDIGLVAAAKTDCQNAADAAAMTGARNLDGSANGNVINAYAAGQQAAEANFVLNQSVQSSEVALSAGAYHYDVNAQTFSPQIPPVAPDNYNLMQATVTYNLPYAFARVFNLTSVNVSATAIAAHRPRDVSIVLDFSGSMNNESDLWNCESYLGNMMNTSNNTDPIFPQWGQYDLAWSPLAAMQCTSSDPRVGYCNVSQSVQGNTALVNDFYSNARGSGAQSAFNPAPGSVRRVARRGAGGGPPATPRPGRMTAGARRKRVGGGRRTVPPSLSGTPQRRHKTPSPAARAATRRSQQQARSSPPATA